MPSKITVTQVKPANNITFFMPSVNTGQVLVQDFKIRGDLTQVTDVYNNETLTRIRTLIFKDRASLDAFIIDNADHRAATKAYNAANNIIETIKVEDID